MPELLSPAGNFEKMEAAIRYGADAVYLAGHEFGMRSAADNFSGEELLRAVEYAHEKGKKIYFTVNTMPHGDEYERLSGFFRSISECPPDGLIISDLGVFTLAGELLPAVQRHVSTQASVVSAKAAEAWHRLGATRVVLARELSLDEIRGIRRGCSRELSLEAFIHGSMCVSYSGRCLLSNCFTGRDSNRGRCAQPCRWKYHLYPAFEIEEDERGRGRLPVYEDEHGTFVMSSKDMCMIEHIPELYDAGIDSFKIEGRMKSAYYAAVVTNAYRMAMNSYEKDPAGYVFDKALAGELSSVSHREYGTGYYFDSPEQNAQLCSAEGYIREKAYLATVTEYDSSSGRATLIQRNKLFADSDAELITPGKTGVRLHIGALYGEDGAKIDSTPHPSMLFSTHMSFPVKAGDILRAAD